MENPISLRSFLGQKIVLRANLLGTEETYSGKLRGFEGTGIWIESPEWTETFLKVKNIGVSIRTPVFFVPFVRISLLAASVEEVAILEKSLGLGNPQT